jgi:nicotinamidase/pyrazinamidase
MGKRSGSPSGFSSASIVISKPPVAVQLPQPDVSANRDAPQDWHPPTHTSFAASHAGAKPFDTKRLHYGDQTLWPEHCVQGAPGAALHPDLAVDRAFLILRKGMHSAVDSYSAFVEADGKTRTGLAALLRARGVKRVFACGLATDFCVAHSALDARNEGFDTFVIEDACRGIDANNSLAEAWARMNAAEVWRIQSGEILGELGSDGGRAAFNKRALTLVNANKR